MSEILNSIVSEVQAMRSGKFIPYHKMAAAVALIVTVIFSVIFSHSTVFEGKISVIDLDGSKASVHFIRALDASSYIHVQEVFRYPLERDFILRHDRVLGVLYIPDGFEEALKRSQSTGIKYFADYLNEAQNAEVIENKNSVAAVFGAPEAAATSAGIRAEIRRLYNPTFTATNGTLSAFLLFFSSLYLGLTVLMVPGRLRLTGAWEREVMMQSPLALLARAIPYALFYTAAICVMIALLTTFGQLRFAGNILLYVPALFLYALSIGWMGFIYAFKATNPGQGVELMIFLIPPGFILGGATMATGVLSHEAWLFSHCFPLTWLYHFQRDLVGRGLSADQMLTLYGALLIYLSILGLLLTLRFARERRRTRLELAVKLL